MKLNSKDSTKLKLLFYWYKEIEGKPYSDLFNKDSKYLAFMQHEYKNLVGCCILYNNQFSKRVFLLKDESDQIFSRMSHYSVNRDIITKLGSERAATKDRSKVLAGSTIMPNQILEKALDDCVNSRKVFGDWKEDLLLRYIFAEYLITKGKYYGKIEKILNNE